MFTNLIKICSLSKIVLTIAIRKPSTIPPMASFRTTSAVRSTHHTLIIITIAIDQRGRVEDGTVTRTNLKLIRRSTKIATRTRIAQTTPHHLHLTRLLCNMDSGRTSTTLVNFTTPPAPIAATFTITTTTIGITIHPIDQTTPSTKPTTNDRIQKTPPPLRHLRRRLQTQVRATRPWRRHHQTMSLTILILPSLLHRSPLP